MVTAIYKNKLHEVYRRWRLYRVIEKARKAIKILIAVVLGALLLAGLYSLFGDTVLPTLVDRIKEMFNYAG